MALDGIYLHCLLQEIEAEILSQRIEKIYQPGREELVFTFRGKSGTKKLYISANATGPRVHFTDAEISNPATPPMFCMLLRKRLGAARLTEIRQSGLERAAYFLFETRNELGDKITLTLAVEIMGRHSNIVLCGDDGVIIDSIKRVDFSISQKRQVLPGLRYELPPAQDKLDLLRDAPEEITARLDAAPPGQLLDKALLGALQGASPVVCREIAYYTGRGAELYTPLADEAQRQRLSFFLRQLQHRLLARESAPVLVTDTSGLPKEFAFLPIGQYGAHYLTRGCDSFSGLLDLFYREKSEKERLRQRSGDLLRLIVNATERTAKKIETQRAEYDNCEKRDEYKQYGDLISANVYRMEKGDRALETEDFYHENRPVTIALDERLTPVQNAQRYYRLYKKAANAEKILREQMDKARDDLIYLDSVFDAVSRTASEEELSEIRLELAQQGYIRHGRVQTVRKPPGPRRYLSSEGFSILCGRNNLQNDKLTLKTAARADIWLHTKDIPGSHTIIETGGREAPPQTLFEAAVIAAYNSKGRSSSQVPVDYTPVHNVKKPAGAKPGMVIYVKNKTLYVTPDEALVKKLQK